MTHKKYPRKAKLYRNTRARIAIAMLALCFCTWMNPEVLFAINPNIPDLLVNTESFQTIDPGDGTSVIDLRFGENLNARLYYDTSNTRFNFTKNVFIQGQLTATGAVKFTATLSGNVLHAEKTLTSSGNLLVKDNMTTFQGSVGTRFGLSFLSGGILDQMSGFNNFFNGRNAGFGTNSVTRLTSEGNLQNIGSIQSGEAHLRRGGTLLAKTDYTAGTNPQSIASGDLNSDGRQDLAVANNGSSTVSVFINSGSSFNTKVDYATGTFPISVAIGDLNGDGKPDLAVSNNGAATVSVLLNNGNGAFAPKIDYSVTGITRQVAIGDLNGDGRNDMAVVIAGSSVLSVLINSGSTFNTKRDYTTGTTPFGVAIGDVNGDGKQDLVSANFGATSMSVLLNAGNGTFAAKVDYTAGTQPYGIAVGDVNGDRKSDIVVTNLGSASVSVFMNSGSTFNAKRDYTTGTGPLYVALGDMNGDGKSDLTTANNDAISLFLNNGNGTFAAKTDYTTNADPRSIAMTDLNSDGKLDLAVATFTNNVVSVLLNDAKTILFASSSTGGAVGIGTATPGSALSVSGSMIIGPNLTNRAARTQLEVIGTISGTTLNAQSLLTGSTLQGFGLFNCQGTANKLTYDATTKKFLCEADQNSGGPGGAPEVGTAAFSGATLRLGDARYVKKQGDTMTGALTINLSSGFLGLKIIQMASGSVIHAERTLTSSGMLKVRQTDIQGSGALVVDQVRGSTGAYIRGSGSHIRQPLLALDSSTGSTHAPHLLFGYLGRFDVNLYRATGGVLRTNGSFIATGSVSGAYLTFMGAQSSYILGSLGIGKANPSTKLEVVGTISGSFIRASNLTVSGAVLYSSGNLIKQNAKGASGQLLISQGTSAPVWKDQKTALVWYLDSTVATGTNQSAIVTMPFGLVASSGSLRIKGAPTGSALTVDIRKDGTSIYSTKPSIPAGAITAKNGVFSTTNLTEGSEISLSVTQVGSTFAGSGLTIMLTGNRKY